MRRCVLALLCAFGLLSAPARAQQNAADAILILDASGSMWGQVDGRPKIEAARKAVDTILSRWRSGDRLGLMAYGHRSKGECRDIELIAPVGTVDAEAIRKSVGALNPRGKTPIAASLREAARILKHTETKATVILVSDGIETCDPDPCAVAAELRKAGVGFTAHVVGFDITDPLARTQLECIARSTGGVYLDARNAAGLETAMTKVAAASQGTRVASEAPATVPPPPAIDVRNLRATARLAESSDPLTDPQLGWHLHLRKADGDAGDLHEANYGARLAMTAPPGDYILLVTLGSTTRPFPLTIDAKTPLNLDLVLDAGFVTSAGAVEGSGDKAEGVSWEVHRTDGEHVATVYDAVPSFVLPAGDYTLKLAKGAASISQPFSVAAGDSINLAVSLSVGRLAIDAVFAAAGPKVEEGFAVEIRRPAKAVGEEGEWVATFYDPLSIVDLPAGAYDVKAGTGEAHKVLRVEMVSGRENRITVDLNAGFVAMAGANGQIQIVETRKSITGKRKIVSATYHDEMNAALPAGDYVAIVTRDGVESETPFRVAAGERVEVSLK